MQIETNQMISVGKLQKELTGKLREVTAKEQPLFIMRNNTLAAVILSPAEYDHLQNAASLLEHLEISEMIEKRANNNDRSRNVSWDEVKRERGL